jgi:hypothetical protein
VGIGRGRGRGRVAVGGGRWEAGEAGAKLPGCSEGLSPSFLCYFSGFFFRNSGGERGSVACSRKAPSFPFWDYFRRCYLDLLSLVPFICPSFFPTSLVIPTSQAGADYRFHLYRCISVAARSLSRFTEGESRTVPKSSHAASRRPCPHNKRHPRAKCEHSRLALYHHVHTQSISHAVSHDR